MTTRKHSQKKISPYATSLTRGGKLNMANRKPYRTPEQQNEARAAAVLKDGRYVSSAPVSFSKQKRKVAA